MAKKFERPPNFCGASEEDVVEFIQRYEQVAKYNGWKIKELNDNLEMYLRGLEEKWWRCLDARPTDWKVIGVLGGGRWAGGDRSRQKKRWDDQGRPICYICKDTGHLMRDCDSRKGRPLRRARREDEDMDIRTTSTMENRSEQTESEPAQTEESRQLGISPPPKEDKCEEIGFPDELLLSAEEEEGD